MKEIYFINSWQDIKSAWSGTPNGLFNALSKYVEVRELHLHKKSGRIAQIINSLTMQMIQNRFIEKQIDRTAIPDNQPVFAFGEYRSKSVKNTYCYQDLSVDYILRLRQQAHTVSNFALAKIIPTPIVKMKNQRAKRFYQDCAGVFTMSEWLRNDLIENTGLPAEKVHHVGGGCSIDVTRIDSSKKQGKRFLFVGKDWNRKNGTLVVEAFQKLSAQYPDFSPELYIAGPTDKPECIPETDNIIFLGRLTHEELIQYYNLCDYFVMPSIFEAYGLVFVEALCFGLPCIGNDICAMPEFIQEGQNGLLIYQNSADELAKAMKQMLEEGPSMARYLEENRNVYIQKYSWNSVANRIIQVLHTDGFL